jgi:ketosteroid isomerase-like protein
MSQENLDAVGTVYQQWGRGNLGAGRELYDRFVLYIPLVDFPAAAYYVGPEGAGEFMREYLKEWTNLTISAEELIDAGDSVVVAVQQRAEGMRSGTTTEFRYFSVWTFRAGTVIRLEDFRDRTAALEAAGLSN